EVDELGKRALERCRRIEPRCVLAEQIVGAHERPWVGLEKARYSAKQRGPVRGRVGKSRPGRKAPEFLASHAAPELLQPINAILRLIASDQAGIDRADGCADDSIRLNVGFVQSLVDAGLIGAKRAAALKHEHHLKAFCVGSFFSCRPLLPRSWKLSVQNI